MREIVIAQKTTNDFVKNQFYNLKTKVEQGQKNHQAAIQDLETKFVEYLALADLGSSINLMPYSLYAALSGTTMKPTRMNFVILQMEEDDRVPLILGRPFLHTTDAIIRVKNKELNLGIGDNRATFHIDKAMQHFHVNDGTCFRMDVIDDITEDELDALLFANTKSILRTMSNQSFRDNADLTQT
ncbi:hypothetical protein Tco_0556052 [Tanacetum coccineum]